MVSDTHVGNVAGRCGSPPDRRHIGQITASRLFPTRFPSPRPFLETLAALEWHPALRLPEYRARRKSAGGAAQARLFPLDAESHEAASHPG
jgi:hypothetical protein